MRLSDDLPKWLAIPLRLLLYAFVMFILFNICLAIVKSRLLNNTLKCTEVTATSPGGLSHAKSMVACLRRENSYFEDLLMRPIYAAIDAMPNHPQELVGVWEAVQPRCTYRHTLKANGEFISEPVECSLGDDTFHGSWGVFDKQMLWLADEGLVWPPDINALDMVDKNFFLLTEKDGSRTRFTRLPGAAEDAALPAPAPSGAAAAVAAAVEAAENGMALPIEPIDPYVEK